MDVIYTLGFWAKFSCVNSAVLHTALRLGVFDHLLQEGTSGLTLSRLAERLPASLRGTRVLVEPLIATQLLCRDDEGQLTISPDIGPLLSEPGFRAKLDEAIDWWGPSTGLLEAVKSGSPITYGERSWDVLKRYSELFSDKLTPPHESAAAEDLFDRFARHFMRTQALVCTADLGLFERINATAQPLASLAELVGVPEEGLAVLLDTLTHMGVLEADAGGYRYHPEVGKVLSQRSGASYAQGLGLITAYWDALGRLAEAVVHDRRTIHFNNTVQGEQYYLKLARYNTAIFPSYFGLIRDVPKTLMQARALADTQVLDVGAGSGVWGAAFAHAEPTMQVTFFDQPQVLAQTRHNMERLKLSDRAHFLPGNLLDADYGEACFDVILLGQICHTQDPADLVDLFKRLARALRPDGWLVLADSVLNDRRDAPRDYLYFGIKMFVSTSGEVLSLAEYTSLLEGAGLTVSRCYKLAGTGVDVIMASRVTSTLPETLNAATPQAIQL